MEQKYVIFFAIVLGAVIIGGFIYSAMTGKPAVPTSNYSASTEQNDSLVSPETACQADNHTVVTKVIDGDTVVVEGGEHIRLLGMDADERNYPCYNEAKTRLEQLVLGKPVILEKDTTDVDQYGRCLRTIFLDGQNIDVKLVREGLAVARFYPPDVKYKQEISLAESQAIAEKAGCKWNK